LTIHPARPGTVLSCVIFGLLSSPVLSCVIFGLLSSPVLCLLLEFSKADPNNLEAQHCEKELVTEVHQQNKMEDVSLNEMNSRMSLRCHESMFIAWRSLRPLTHWVMRSGQNCGVVELPSQLSSESASSERGTQRAVFPFQNPSASPLSPLD
jgi:hypothetical protein